MLGSGRAERSYDQVDAVDIGGPGLVRSGGGFEGGGFGLAGAAERMAIAAVLNAITSQVTSRPSSAHKGPHLAAQYGQCP